MSIKLSENEYYVMGDNRDNSYDSRSFGAINKDDIIAKTVRINYSKDALRIKEIR